ncbi:DinB family protein [Flavitalea antarctica]
MNKIIKLVAVCFVFYAIPFLAMSQPFSIDDIKKGMITDWTRSRAYTLRFLDAMPGDQYGFKPVDSVMTFAGQMIHLAVTNSFLVFMASDQTPPEFTFADIDSRPNSNSKDSVKYYITQSYDYCIRAIGSLNSEKWGQKKKLSDQSKSRYEFLQNAYEHQAHHRGQVAVYLRLQGIIPPEANLF